MNLRVNPNSQLLKRSMSIKIRQTCLDLESLITQLDDGRESILREQQTSSEFNENILRCLQDARALVIELCNSKDILDQEISGWEDTATHF